jgi:hypothetical protein
MHEVTAFDMGVDMMKYYKTKRVYERIVPHGLIRESFVIRDSDEIAIAIKQGQHVTGGIIISDPEVVREMIGHFNKLWEKGRTVNSMDNAKIALKILKHKLRQKIGLGNRRK